MTAGPAARTVRALGWGIAWTLIALPAVEIVGRQLTRVSWLPRLPAAPLDLAIVAAIGFALALLLASIATGRFTRPGIVTATTLAALFAIGLAFQLHAGARLQSDGFYYFAYLRSIVFDHDVNFMNDYPMLGLDRHAQLFMPTATGYAQSAWTIGPAFVWAPFFAAGHAAALWLTHIGRDVATDGSSFPYRQAVVIAGLFYALLGAWCTFRLVNHFFDRAIAALATTVTVGGSFIVWYAIAEPTMTHAASMAGVAAFVWLWIATRDDRQPWQWTALGLLAGFIGLIRWQNLIFAVLPACDSVVLLWRAINARRTREVRRVFISGLLFLAAAGVGFLPQLMAWKSIYGQYFAVSPIGPEIRLADPHVFDVLFSLRNGLFTMSPALGLAACGLILFARRRPEVGIPVLVATAVMTYFNASIADWWGSAAFGGRRFDGIVPIAALGTAAICGTVRDGVRARPYLVPAAMLGLAVLWNVTYLDARRRTPEPASHGVDFRVVSGEQARTFVAALSHPFSGRGLGPIPAPAGRAMWFAGLLSAILAFLASYRLVRSRFTPITSTVATVGVFAGSFLWPAIGGVPAVRVFVSAAASALVLMFWQKQIDRRITFHWIYSGLIGGALTGAAAVLMALPATWPVRFAGFSGISGALWSTDGGLLATSAALFLAAAGWILLAKKDRRLSLASLSACGVVASLAAARDQEMAPSHLIMFATLVPAFACGAAGLWSALTTLSAERAHGAVAVVLSPLILWNLTLVGAARRGEYRLGEPVVMSNLARDQAGVLHDWMGHPWSFPANALFAVRNGVGLGDYDVLYSGRLFANPTHTTERIDIGENDERYIGEGWHAREENDAGTFRWARARAGITVPLDRALALELRIDLDPAEAPGIEPQRLHLVVNGRALDDRTLSAGEQVVTIQAPKDLWRAGVNRVLLEFGREIRPSDRGLGDLRPLAAQVRMVELQALP